MILGSSTSGINVCRNGHGFLRQTWLAQSWTSHRAIPGPSNSLDFVLVGSINNVTHLEMLWFLFYRPILLLSSLPILIICLLIYKRTFRVKLRTSLRLRQLIQTLSPSRIVFNSAFNANLSICVVWRHWTDNELAFFSTRASSRLRFWYTFILTIFIAKFYHTK